MNLGVLTMLFLVGISAMIPQVLAASNDRPDAYVKWLEDRYPSTGTGVVRVVDHYMNQDSDAVESLTVDVYVEPDIDGGIKVTVTETNVATGIFEGTVFFSETHESSGHRLHVADRDAISVEYTYSAVPDSDLLEDMIAVGHEISIKNSQDIEQETAEAMTAAPAPADMIDDGYYAMIFIGGVVAVIIVVLVKRFRK